MEVLVAACISLLFLIYFSFLFVNMVLFVFVDSFCVFFNFNNYCD
jgi:hypothetical protein